MKKISIIIPFNKGLCYLDDCFDSVLAQNLDKNEYEVICLGDMPEEGIVAKLEEFENKGLPVRYVQWLPSHGTGYARNTGINLAEGEYIYFLDCDDYILEGCLNRMLECAAEYDADVVAGGIKHTFFKRDSLCADSEEEFVNTDRKGTDADIAGIFADEVTVLNMLIKKDVIDANDIKFADNVSYFSDMPFVMKLLSAANVFYLVADAYLAKRERNDPIHLPQLNQSMVKEPEKMLHDMLAVYPESIKYTEGQPKRRNIVMYMLCKNVLKVMESGYIPKKEIAVCAEYTKQAVKNVSSRFRFSERLTLSCIASKKPVQARICMAYIIINKKKSGKFGNKIQWFRFIDKLIFSHMGRKDNWIVFESFFGRGYNDSPKAIYDYMLNTYGGQFRYIWILSDKHKKTGKNTRYAVYNGLKHVYYASRSKYHVYNVRQPGWFVKKKGMVFLETWHGTPLKKLVFDMDDVYSANRNHKVEFYRDSRKWDYLISDNRFSTDIFEHAFDIDRDKIIETGYPRNDILYAQNASDIVKKVKNNIGMPEDKKVILYAPTWRDNEYYEAGKYKFDTALDFSLLKEHLSDEWILLLRTHYYIAEKLDLSEYEGFVYNVSGYGDISELYLISDVCITDYSSVFFDYANLKRPVLFYVYDIENYKNELRGMYLDMETELPGPLLYTSEEVLLAIENLSQLCQEYKEKYNMFYERFCSLSDGQASKRAAELLIGRRRAD